MKTHGETGMNRREGKSCKQHTKVREVTWIGPSCLPRMSTLPTPLSQTSGCENSGNINFSCFKPPTWSWFVLLDPRKSKNKYKIHLPSWDRCYDVMIHYLVHSQVWTEYTTSSWAVPVGALTQLQLYLTFSFCPCLCLPPPFLLMVCTPCQKSGISSINSLKLRGTNSTTPSGMFELWIYLIAVLAKFHRWGDFSTAVCFLAFLGTKSPRWRCWQVCFSWGLPLDWQMVPSTLSSHNLFPFQWPYFS